MMYTACRCRMQSFVFKKKSLYPNRIKNNEFYGKNGFFRQQVSIQSFIFCFYILIERHHHQQMYFGTVEYTYRYVYNSHICRAAEIYNVLIQKKRFRI